MDPYGRPALRECEASRFHLGTRVLIVFIRARLGRGRCRRSGRLDAGGVLFGGSAERIAALADREQTVLWSAAALFISSRSASYLGRRVAWYYTAIVLAVMGVFLG